MISEIVDKTSSYIKHNLSVLTRGIRRAGRLCNIHFEKKKGLNLYDLDCFQQMPIVIAGTEEQKKKYLGRMIEEPLMCVSKHNIVPW